MYTPRGDIRAKQAENPLKLDVSRDFVSGSDCFFERGDFVKPLSLSFLRLWSHAFFDSLKESRVILSSLLHILLRVSL